MKIVSSICSTSLITPSQYSHVFCAIALPLSLSTWFTPQHRSHSSCHFSFQLASLEATDSRDEMNTLSFAGDAGWGLLIVAAGSGGGVFSVG